jgi:hypothetical protein
MTGTTALTPEGRKWATANAAASIIARVALGGRYTDWPEAFVTTAINFCNKNGEQ